MSEIDVQSEVQLDSSPPGEAPSSDPLQGDMSGTNRDTGHQDLEEQLMLLADVALASPCARLMSCLSPEVKWMESSVQSMELQLEFLLNKADNLYDCVISGQDHVEKEALASAVSSLLFTCQPYFNHLESIAQNMKSQYSHMPLDLCSKLMDFSQQLCDKLKQLLLTFASYDLVSLDETDPNSVSPFCTGQTQLGRLKLTVFTYCKPTPYLAQVYTGLYKCMRWNVVRLCDEQGGVKQDVDDETQTDYYFLCYEDLPNGYADRDTKCVPHGDVTRTWSIGRWVQVNPEPQTEDICDWIICEVPQGSFHKLLSLGPDEPSSCSATQHLQQLLLSCYPVDNL